MNPNPTRADTPATGVTERPRIRLLSIQRFRGLASLTWRPGEGLNLVLGGGDVGKTTILDAIALLLSPTHPTTLSDTDYYRRQVEDGFVVEAVMSLPSQSGGIDHQFKPSWPWEWDGTNAIVPSTDGDDAAPGSPVYWLRARGTEDLEIVYEIVQPDGSADVLTAALRRSIGLVRLGGDDRNDRDLRLVQGSALDRLLSDKALRSRIAASLAKTDVKANLAEDKLTALDELNAAFANERLPNGLDLSIVGGQGSSIASMVGLTASLDGVQLPVSTWGAGTRRLSALAVAQYDQAHAAVTLVDEVERGLEPYRQELLLQKLQALQAQVFATTHSPFVIRAATRACFWFMGPNGNVGPLNGKRVARVQATQPATFLSRLSVICEGATEVGFVAALLQRALEAPLDRFGIFVCDGGSNEETLDLLEELTEAGLAFAGFADNEGIHPTRWQAVSDAQQQLLFRWRSGCIEENIISRTPTDKLERLLTDPLEDLKGMRLRTLATRLGIAEKSFAMIAAKAGDGLKAVMIEAAKGQVPANLPEEEKKAYKSHGQSWFKSVAGGREIEDKLFELGLWPTFKADLLPFCNAVRKAIAQSEVEDLA
jgi:putative ATP-dependent endonuclease of OLD family